MSAQAPMADPSPNDPWRPANDAGLPQEDVRQFLRMEHDQLLAMLDALRLERDPSRCKDGLRDVRTAWIVHALAEETVVYRALEGVQGPGGRADERFVEHELVGGLFDKLAQVGAGTLEWNARLNVARELIARHIETEYRDLFPLLGGRFGVEALAGMGARFRQARDMLLVCEEAKAA